MLVVVVMVMAVAVVAVLVAVAVMYGDLLLYVGGLVAYWHLRRVQSRGACAK